MMESAHNDTQDPRPAGSIVIGYALLVGVALGVAAKLIGGVEGAPQLIGMGIAFWVTAGFLVARSAAKGRGLLDGTVWAGTAMAVYLGAWLLGYCFVFGLQQSGGFGAAWLDERRYFIIAPFVSLLLGLIAAASRRVDWFGDVCLAAPIAWSLPEAGFALSQGPRYALAALPPLLIACVPLASSRGRRPNRVAVAATCVAGGALMVLALHIVDGRFF